MEQGVLTVHLRKGSGLKAADLNGKSDPYVQVSVGAQRKQSKVVERTLDPVWNEEFEFEGTLQELVAYGLHLKVFDKDRFTKDDPLGEVQVNLEPLLHRDAHEFSEALPTQGSLSFSVTWARVPAHLLESGTLRVHLQQGTGLKAADRNGFSDPYVKLSLAGQQHKSKTIKKTLNPKWDEYFEFKGVLRDLLAESLQLHVFDWDMVGKDDKLGNASIDLRALRGTRERDYVADLSMQGRVHLHVSWAAQGQQHASSSWVASPPSRAPAGSSRDHATPASGGALERAVAAASGGDREKRLLQRQQELLGQAGQRGRPQAAPLQVPLGPRPLAPPPPPVQIPGSTDPSPLPSAKRVVVGSSGQLQQAPSGIVVKGAKSEAAAARAATASASSGSGKKGGFLSRNRR